MNAISTAPENKQTSLFEAIFFSKIGRWVTHLSWLAGIILIMFFDQNPYPVLGGVLWIICFLLFVFGSWAYFGFPTKSENPDAPISFKDIWFFFPFSSLIFMSVSLFIAGDPSHYPGYIVQQNRLSGTVRVNMANELLVFHTPLVETNNFWTVGQTVKTSSVATTADGKKIVAKLEVELAIDDNASTFSKLGTVFGKPEAYKVALQKAVEAQFAKTVAQYKLSEMPNNLMLEDLVGTRIGLDGLFATWKGAFKITEVHRFADK